jgi:hypothetical protein
MLYPATRAEVWMPPGRTAGEVMGQQAWAYREPRPEPVVELVLGAGNVSSIALRDLLYGMFVENRVVVLKCNPVNDYLAPHWERAFRALVEAGFLRIVTGDAAAGAYLAGHPDVGHIHMTGSDKTFEAVVFGPGPDGAARKARGKRLVEVPVTVEGGNVSPVIIVPGRWSSAELRYQAAHLATMLANNAGFNCNAARVIVTAAAWPQRQAFLDALEHALGSLPPRRAYYPGAAELHAAFLQRHPDARRLGKDGEGTLPWTLVRGADPHDPEDPCFTTEAFCSLMAETALPATIDQRVPRPRGALLQRHPLGHAMRHADRQAPPRHRDRRRDQPRRARPALRLGGRQPLGRQRLRAERLQLGRLPRPHRQRHPVRARHRRQHLHAARPRKVRHARTISLPTPARVVRRPHQLRADPPRPRPALGEPLARHAHPHARGGTAPLSEDQPPPAQSAQQAGRAASASEPQNEHYPTSNRRQGSATAQRT